MKYVSVLRKRAKARGGGDYMSGSGQCFEKTECPAVY